MGSLTTCCPPADTLESASTVVNPCPSDIGQVQKAIFWRSGNSLSLATSYPGVLDFDGVDDIVNLTGFPTASITGSKIISFSLQLHTDPSSDECVFSFQGDTTDWLSFELDESSNVFAPKIGGAVGTWDFSAYIGQCIDIEITKSAPGGTAQIDDFKINGVSVVSAGAGGVVGNTSTKSAVGCRYLGSSTKQLFFESGYVWNIQISGLHGWDGQPSGNTNAAWVDDIGSIDGTVVGSPAIVSACSDVSYYLSATTWDALLAATGDTKAIITPFSHAFELPIEPRESEDNNRYNATLRKGGQSPIVSKKFYAEQQSVVASLKKLRCESVEVIFVNEANQFIYSDREGDFRGFPVVNNSLWVSDKLIGGHSIYDTNRMKFNLEPNYSDSLEVSEQTTFALNMI